MYPIRSIILAWVFTCLIGTISLQASTSISSEPENSTQNEVYKRIALLEEEPASEQKQNPNPEPGEYSDLLNRIKDLEDELAAEKVMRLREVAGLQQQIIDQSDRILALESSFSALTEETKSQQKQQRTLSRMQPTVIPRPKPKMMPKPEALEAPKVAAVQQQTTESQQQQAAVRQASASTDGSVPSSVGERPTEEYREPTVNLLSDVGGILSPKGAFYVEPQLSLSASSDNRFFFNGVEIIDGLLIGLINATDTDRTSATFRQGFRYGVTSRIELDATIPFVTQENRISGVQIDNQNGELRDLNNDGIGDVTAGIHLQLNDGERYPYTIANLRVKAPTGDGPFDINPDEETPTGSGYWTIEPSLTFIQPVDPAVLFANIGYQYNVEYDVNDFIGNEESPTRAFVRTVDPGDAIRTSFGVGLSLNEAVSLNFGYDQNYIFSSRFTSSSGEEIDEENPIIRSEGQEITVGSFLFGASYSPTNRINFSFNTSIGATDEAPDATITLKSRIRLND